mmetsp:Transcript_36003/g.39800  ORF Transcript_36003/g.39800 Transcript_36003/m.39800 type:complete len:102 (+) Transcript_36003:2066-2371(+)
MVPPTRSSFPPWSIAVVPPLRLRRRRRTFRCRTTVVDIEIRDASSFVDGISDRAAWRVKLDAAAPPPLLDAMVQYFTTDDIEKNLIGYVISFAMLHETMMY